MCDGLRIRSHAPASSASLHRTLSPPSFSLHCPPIYITPPSSLWHHNPPCQLSLKHERIERYRFALYRFFIFFNMEDHSGNKKRVRDDSGESVLESSEAKRLRDDLLEFFDDADPTPSTTQDLDSVMKSLQEEISASSSPASLRVTSDSGESQAQIGYLLEASDDELGLPPPGNSSAPEGKSEEAELVRVSSDSSGIGELWEFEDQIPSYDSFDLGTGFGYESNIEYVAFDGLFNHSDGYYDSNDFSDSWRHGTLPAEERL